MKISKFIVFFLLSYITCVYTQCEKITRSTSCPEWNGKYMINPDQLTTLIETAMDEYGFCPSIRYAREFGCSQIFQSYGSGCTENTKPLFVCKRLCVEFWESVEGCLDSSQINPDTLCQGYPTSDCVDITVNVAGPLVGATVAAAIAGAAGASAASTSSTSSSGAAGGAAINALWALVSQAQFIAITGQFDIIYPQAYADFTKAFSWTNFVLDVISKMKSAVGSADAANYIFVNNILTIALVMSLIAGVYVLLKFYVLFRFGTVEQEHQEWKQVLNDAFSSISLRVALLAYYQLCISASTEILAVHWMLFVAIGVLLFFHIPFPLFVYYYLKIKFNQLIFPAKEGKEVNAAAKSEFQTRFGSLYNSYKEPAYYFSSISLINKFICGLAIGFAHNEFYVQVSFCLAVYLTYTFLLLWKRPFQDDFFNNTEIAVTIKDIVVLVLLIILKNIPSTPVALTLIILEAVAIGINVLIICMKLGLFSKCSKKPMNEEVGDTPEEAAPVTLASKLKQLWKGENSSESTGQKIKRLTSPIGQSDISQVHDQIAKEDKKKEKNKKKDDKKKEDKAEEKPTEKPSDPEPTKEEDIHVAQDQ